MKKYICFREMKDMLMVMKPTKPEWLGMEVLLNLMESNCPGPDHTGGL